MLVRNCWYVAAWDYEIPRAGIFSRTIANEPLVFYRKTDGQVVVLEDRCCHRHAPLSEGQHVGDDLRCMYHGLRFGPDGRCVEIPGQAAIPERARVRNFPVREQQNWIWVWMGDPAAADATLIPKGIIALQDPGWTLKSGYLTFNADYMLIVDNLLDFSHITYVHEQTFGGTDVWATQRPKIERIDRGIRVSRWLMDGAPPRYLPKFKNHNGNIDRWSTYDFLVPGILLLHSDMYPAGSNVNDKSNLIFTYTSSSVVTPETSETSHYFFRWGPQSHENPAIADILLQAADAGFAEDRKIIEAQQRVINRGPGPKMVSIAADAGLIQMRRVFDELSRAETVAHAAE
jgi:phenylpropionate dioxygenase-like ring-hydroxylating dioxygenase large terminal subunit